MTLQSLQSPLAASSEGESIGNAKPQEKQRVRRSPVELLTVIRHGIVAEETQLHFDYLEFNRRCMEFLRRVRERLVRDFPGLTLEGPLSSVAGAVFYAADRYRNAPLSEESAKSYPGAQVGGAYLQAVARDMQQMIERQGFKEIERARKCSSEV